MPYIDYIAAALELYAMICLDRNEKATKILPTKLGLSNVHVRAAIEKNLNKKLRAAYIFLAQVLFIDMEFYVSMKKP